MRTNIYPLTLAFLILSASAFSTTIRVPADQPAIQAGINAGVSGDTVLVASGLWTGAGNRDIDFHGRKILLRSEAGASATIIDCQGSVLEPHRAFNFHSNEDTSAVVDGFTIRGGYGLSDSPGGVAVGGGIRCDTSSSPIIRNCVIYANAAHNGGGMYIGYQSRPRIRECTIRRNTASFGGAIVALKAYLYIDHCTLDSNVADSGGAIGGYTVAVSAKACSIVDNSIRYTSGGGVKLAKGSIDMDSCDISRNTALTYRYASAGGMDLSQISYAGPSSITNCTFESDSGNSVGGLKIDTTSQIEVSHCQFIGNYSQGSGAGLTCNGAATIKGCLFENNRAGNPDFGDGGGIYARGKAIIDSCAFFHNWADSYGGGVSCQDSSPVITNCTFVENEANSGGGLDCHTSSASVSWCTFIANSGGAILAEYYSSPTISNCTMYGNFSGGTAASHIFCYMGSRPTLDRCILAFGSQNPAVYCFDPVSLPPPEASRPTMLCCDVFGNVDGDWVGCIQDQLGSNGNITIDPLFCDTANHDLGLEATSPCWPGNNSCYQLIGAVGKSCNCCTGPTTGDVDASAGVDISDLAATVDYLFNSLPFPGTCFEEQDTDKSGSVDISDLQALIDFLFFSVALPNCP